MCQEPPHGKFEHYFITIFSGPMCWQPSIASCSFQGLLRPWKVQLQLSRSQEPPRAETGASLVPIHSGPMCWKLSIFIYFQCVRNHLMEKFKHYFITIFSGPMCWQPSIASCSFQGLLRPWKVQLQLSRSQEPPRAETGASSVPIHSGPMCWKLSIFIYFQCVRNHLMEKFEHYFITIFSGPMCWQPSIASCSFQGLLRPWKVQLQLSRSQEPPRAETGASFVPIHSGPMCWKLSIFIYFQCVRNHLMEKFEHYFITIFSGPMCWQPSIASCSFPGLLRPWKVQLQLSRSQEPPRAETGASFVPIHSGPMCWKLSIFIYFQCVRKHLMEKFEHYFITIFSGPLCWQPSIASCSFQGLLRHWKLQMEMEVEELPCGEIEALLHDHFERLHALERSHTKDRMGFYARYFIEWMSQEYMK